MSHSVNLRLYHSRCTILLPQSHHAAGVLMLAIAELVLWSLGTTSRTSRVEKAGKREAAV